MIALGDAGEEGIGFRPGQVSRLDAAIDFIAGVAEPDIAYR
jgi:hypothetical protein